MNILKTRLRSRERDFSNVSGQAVQEGMTSRELWRITGEETYLAPDYKRKRRSVSVHLKYLVPQLECVLLSKRR